MLIDYERFFVCYFSTTKFMIAMTTEMLQIVSALKSLFCCEWYSPGKDFSLFSAIGGHFFSAKRNEKFSEFRFTIILISPRNSAKIKSERVN